MNVKVGQETVDVTSDAVLIDCDSEETENGNGRTLNVESDAFVSFILDVFDFNLLEDWRVRECESVV